MLLALALVATLQWSAPTLNTDASAVTPPLTFNVFQGARGTVKPLVASKLTGLSYTADIAKGLCFEVDTTDKDGDEGPHSAEACAPSVPLPPGGFKFILVLTP